MRSISKSYLKNLKLGFFSCIILGGVVLLTALSARATDGHQLAGLGAIQAGNGGAGVASAKDSTWVLLNPAGIVDLERRIDISFEVFAPNRSLEPKGPILLPLANPWAGEMSDDSIFYIPAIGAIFPHKQGAFGIGLFAVNGMGVDYDDSRTTIPFIFGRNFDRKTEYGVAKLALGYAYDLGEGWSLGATANLLFSQFATDMLTLDFWETEGDNRKDTSLGGGVTLGIQKKWDRLSLGASYSTPQWVDRLKKYQDLFSHPIDLPQMAQVGVAYRFTPRVEWLLDYKFIDWSGVRQIGKDPILGGLGWEDQHVIKSGLTWQLHPKWALRAGASYAKSPIGEEVVFANGLFPAIAEAHAMLGCTYAIGERSEIHFTYEHAFGKSLTENGRGDLFSIVGRGTEIYLEEDTFTVQYSYKF